MIVYGDLLFLINFSMDFLCFYFSCLLMHKRLPTIRACIASAIGGLYSVCALFIKASSGVALTIDISVLVLMCFIVYINKGMDIFKFIKMVILYFAISALLGGVMTALFSFLNKLNLFGSQGTDENDINVWVFALLATLGSIFTLNFGRFFRTSSSKKTVNLRLEDGTEHTDLVALVDSGNLAVEPMSNKGVAFANLESCKRVIDNDLYEFIKNGCGVDNMPFLLASKVRFVPSRTVSGSVLVPAVRPKSVKLISGKGEKSLDIYVALVRDGTIKDYDAIISSEVLL